MKRKYILIGLALLLVVAVAAAFLWPVPPRHVVITVSAPPGTKITGTYDVDGVVSPIDADGPYQFEVNGREVRYSIQKDGQPGVMIVQLTVKGRDTAAGAGCGPGESVSGGFRSSGSGITQSAGTRMNSAQPPHRPAPRSQPVTRTLSPA